VWTPPTAAALSVPVVRTPPATVIEQPQNVSLIGRVFSHPDQSGHYRLIETELAIDIVNNQNLSVAKLVFDNGLCNYAVFTVLPEKDLNLQGKQVVARLKSGDTSDVRHRFEYDGKDDKVLFIKDRKNETMLHAMMRVEPTLNDKLFMNRFCFLCLLPLGLSQQPSIFDN
jgi:hypothetical protein